MKELCLILIIVIFLYTLSNFKESFMNCPKMYEKINHKLLEKHIPSLRGFTNNEYIYLTEYYKSKEPMPINAGFFDKM